MVRAVGLEPTLALPPLIKSQVDIHLSHALKTWCVRPESNRGRDLSR